MEIWDMETHANARDFCQNKEWYKNSEQETIDLILQLSIMNMSKSIQPSLTTHFKSRKNILLSKLVAKDIYRFLNYAS